MRIRMTKVRTTRYKDQSGQSTEGTPARKAIDLSDKRYAEWRVNGK